MHLCSLCAHGCPGLYPCHPRNSKITRGWDLGRHRAEEGMHFRIEGCRMTSRSKANLISRTVESSMDRPRFPGGGRGKLVSWKHARLEIRDKPAWVLGASQCSLNERESSLTLVIKGWREVGIIRPARAFYAFVLHTWETRRKFTQRT